MEFLFVWVVAVVLVGVIAHAKGRRTSSWVVAALPRIEGKGSRPFKYAVAYLRVARRSGC